MPPATGTVVSSHPCSRDRTSASPLAFGGRDAVSLIDGAVDEMADLPAVLRSVCAAGDLPSLTADGGPPPPLVRNIHPFPSSDAFSRAVFGDHHRRHLLFHHGALAGPISLCSRARRPTWRAANSTTRPCPSRAPKRPCIPSGGKYTCPDEDDAYHARMPVSTLCWGERRTTRH